MTFDEWWREYLKENLSCINYRRNFKDAWKAATEQCDIQSEKDAEPL